MSPRKPNPSDVICDDDGFEVKGKCKHSGNRRLQSFLDVCSENFAKSDVFGKEAIAQTIVHFVLDESSGQFLQQIGTPTNYEPLPRELAFAYVLNSLDQQCKGKETAKMGEADQQQLGQGTGPNTAAFLRQYFRDLDDFLKTRPPAA